MTININLLSDNFFQWAQKWCSIFQSYLLELELADRNEDLIQTFALIETLYSLIEKNNLWDYLDENDSIKSTNLEPFINAQIYNQDHTDFDSLIYYTLSLVAKKINIKKIYQTNYDNSIPFKIECAKDFIFLSFQIENLFTLSPTHHHLLEQGEILFNFILSKNEKNMLKKVIILHDGMKKPIEWI